MSDYLLKRQSWAMHGKPDPHPSKKVYRIPKKSAKKIEQEKKEKVNRLDGETELVRWFKARQKEMLGVCSECGLKTETQIYQYAIHSICHILAKRPTVCPSVATCPENWIELCPHHHDVFDKSTWEEIEKWGCWPEVLNRLMHVAPYLYPDEKRHVPDIVWDKLEQL